MLYALAFSAGALTGVVGVFAWLAVTSRSDAPGYLADVLRGDPAIKDRR